MTIPLYMYWNYIVHKSWKCTSLVLYLSIHCSSSKYWLIMCITVVCSRLPFPLLLLFFRNKYTYLSVKKKWNQNMVATKDFLSHSFPFRIRWNWHFLYSVQFHSFGNYPVSSAMLNPRRIFYMSCELKPGSIKQSFKQNKWMVFILLNTYILVIKCMAFLHIETFNLCKK